MHSKKARLAAVLGAGVVLLSTPAMPAALAQQGPNQGPPTQQAGQANFGNLISALNNISAQIQNVQALNNLDINDVQLVNVQDVLNGNNVQALNNALNRNLNNVEILRDGILNGSLNNFDILRNALKNADINVSRVVAVDVLSGGDVIVFYQ